ncbi:MAG: hypothetical protein AAFY16_11815, partial [Cyanobacteria bacterium J06642_3]
NGIIDNFQEWHCQTFDDGTVMHSQKFSGEIHSQLKDNFTSAYNLFSDQDRTIIVSCFVTYSNIAVLLE